MALIYGASEAVIVTVLLIDGFNVVIFSPPGFAVPPEKN